MLRRSAYQPLSANEEASTKRIAVIGFAASLCLGVAVGLFLPTSNSSLFVSAPELTTKISTTTVNVLQSQQQQVTTEGPYNVATEVKLEDSPPSSSREGSSTLTASIVSLASLAIVSAILSLRRNPVAESAQCAAVDLASVHSPCSWALASSAAVKSPIYVINGFYMAMREKYTCDGAAILYMLAEWDSAALSWKDFRGKVLGATDPVTAPEGSIRRTILDTYKDLGLATEPNVGDNGVHASASPFEALVERMNWIGAKLETDPFGKALLEAGVPKDTVLAWTKDPQVEFEGQKRGLFDIMEDLNVQDCLKRAQTIAGVSGPITATKNQAFVFVKPHAMTPEAIALAKAKLTAAGITLGDSGRLDNKTIGEKMLIDNHYYAIANKASLTKPKDLNPPAAKQEEFAQLFGENWADMLAQGRVYNALDACTALGVSGNSLDGIWGAAKKGGKLVKFGGGFYVGQLEP